MREKNQQAMNEWGRRIDDFYEEKEYLAEVDKQYDRRKSAITKKQKKIEKKIETLKTRMYKLEEDQLADIEKIQKEIDRLNNDLQNVAKDYDENLKIRDEKRTKKDKYVDPDLAKKDAEKKSNATNKNNTNNSTNSTNIQNNTDTALNQTNLDQNDNIQVQESTQDSINENLDQTQQQYEQDATNNDKIINDETQADIIQQEIQ